MLFLYVATQKGITAVYLKGSSDSPEVTSIVATFWFSSQGSPYSPWSIRLRVQTIQRTVPHALMKLVVRSS